MIEIKPKTSFGFELDLPRAYLGDGSQDPFPEQNSLWGKYERF